MKLPDNILRDINLEVSRHNHPEDLDWSFIAGSWVASEGERCFVILHDTAFGYVIAEKKGAIYGLGADIE